MAKTNDQDLLFIGMDLGGTKIQASLIDESGTMLASKRSPTPRDLGPRPILDSLVQIVHDLLEEQGLSDDSLAAIGLAVAGMVDPKKGKVIQTPNLDFSNVKVVNHLQKYFSVPVALENDTNLGALGEAWLGAARNTASSVAILVGTGIGAGLVSKGKIWPGSRNIAMEIGHIFMQKNGQKCGCGGAGCFETLASRTAVEKTIQQQVQKGKKTILTDLLQGDLSVIRSGALRQALEQKDLLTHQALSDAAYYLAHACLTIRHLIDPDVIVLGGGLIEACGEFIMPILEKITDQDPLPGSGSGGRILLSALGDDAVVLGAVALARKKIKRNPFQKHLQILPHYPKIALTKSGTITVSDKTFKEGIYIRVDGKPRKIKPSMSRQLDGPRQLITPKTIRSLCKGGPQAIFIAANPDDHIELTPATDTFLKQRAIHCEIAPPDQTIKAFNNSPRRKAVLLDII